MAGRHRGFLWTGWVWVGMGVARRRGCGNVPAVNGSGGLDGVNDLLITSATAEIAFNSAGNFLSARVVVLVEQSLRGDQKTRRTKAALGTTVGGKTRLDWSEVRTVGKTLNRDDIGALNLPGKGEARQFWNPVYHDGATTAGAQITSSLHAKRTHLVS